MNFARRTSALIVTISLAVAVGASPAVAAWNNRAREESAVGYIASQQKRDGSIPAFSPIGSTADAVVSMAAAGLGKDQVRKALNYLRRQTERGNVLAVGLQAKVVLAAVAGGRNPRNFGGINLVTGISGTEQPDGRYGVNTAVFDHALAMLAIEAVGGNPSGNARQWLVDAQCDDGGWQYDDPASANDDQHCQDTIDPGNDFFQSDTNTTAHAVMALEAGAGVQPAVDPLGFFQAIRDVQFGGWGYTWDFVTTDANSTSLAIQAYAASADPLPAGAFPALKDLQYGRRCGAFAFTWVDNGQGGFKRSGPDTGATIGGVLGLLKRRLPVPERNNLLILVQPRIVCPD